MWRAKGLGSSITPLLRYLYRPLSPEFDCLKLLDFYSRYAVELVSRAHQVLQDYPRAGRLLISVTDRGEAQLSEVWPRQRGLAIVRLQSYPPQTSELFYLQAVV